eukprot:358668-Chlamydomonas_euryale.AAC.5
MLHGGLRSRRGRRAPPRETGHAGRLQQHQKQQQRRRPRHPKLQHPRAGVPRGRFGHRGWAAAGGSPRCLCGLLGEGGGRGGDRSPLPSHCRRARQLSRHSGIQRLMFAMQMSVGHSRVSQGGADAEGESARADHAASKGGMAPGGGGVRTRPGVWAALRHQARSLVGPLGFYCHLPAWRTAWKLCVRTSANGPRRRCRDRRARHDHGHPPRIPAHRRCRFGGGAQRRGEGQRRACRSAPLARRAAGGGKGRPRIWDGQHRWLTCSQRRAASKSKAARGQGYLADPASTDTVGRALSLGPLDRSPLPAATLTSLHLLRRRPVCRPLAFNHSWAAIRAWRHRRQPALAVPTAARRVAARRLVTGGPPQLRPEPSPRPDTMSNIEGGACGKRQAPFEGCCMQQVRREERRRLKAVACAGTESAI